MIGSLRTRSQKTRMKWVKGHSGNELNEKADRLAGQGASKRTIDDLKTEIPATLKLSGAKLTTLTQKLAYRGIRKQTMQTYKQRNRTVLNIVKIIDFAETHHDRSISEAQIWTGIRNKDLRREIRYFLWMTIHDAYMVGSNWLRPSYSEELQARHECQICGVEESMQHILTECDAPGQKEIWELTEKLWKMKNKKWTKPLIGGILGCANAMFKTEKGKILKRDARLYRILVSEAAYLIWKLRNARVIQSNGEHHSSKNEITNKWLNAINERLTIDCKMTNNKKYGKKALKPALVESTWKGVLKNEKYLPYDWTTGKVGVLVGIEPERSRTGERHIGD
ncbi:uncharacterized protein B0H18DRAFT_1093996 [Fomitopsis serialis]|uniref:uncharacterized protein n=1 Tax=Fomitopsis serialis TaxID=139415 RepID=UPI002007E91E|nr:uncharacterized protein B0H18DRAFT_1093996 [Neoantrodia serialis]KAH9929188.1 hypothetical protein B0H18DRAFT_1093996 [Neoantrodia serialis]